MAAPSRLKPPRDSESAFLIPAGIAMAVLGIAILFWAAVVGPPAEPTPSPSPTPVVTPEPTPDPRLSDWRLVLVNTEHPLTGNYAPTELVDVRWETAVDSRIADDLNAMLDAAREAGHDPLVCAAFRSREKQTELFEGKIQDFLDEGYEQAEAERLAAQWVAIPGTGEHETGLAVDIVSMDYQVLDETQAETPLQQWLMAHCAEYGFILRYPPEKSDITGIVFEPWHYRYVGREMARWITDAGLTLEEFWEQ